MGTQYEVDAATGILMVSDKAGITPDGGIAIKLTNQTGADSVKGTLVEADTVNDNAFKISPVDGYQPIGIVYEDGIANASECWVVVSGIAQVLLKNATNSTCGNWVYVSDIAGRVDATLAAPPGGGIPELDNHMQEVGHALETKTGGTDVLCRIVVHFN